MMTHASKSAAIRDGLNHPVIDSDGHVIEFEPDVLDYLKQFGGTKIVKDYSAARDKDDMFNWYSLSWKERRDNRATSPPWWGITTKNTLDLATATLPKLLYERLDEIGLDFTVLYPTLGLLAVYPEDEEVRRSACRAYNTY